MKKLMVTSGFVTNSSSMICWFDRKVLDDPNVQAFMKAYEIENGYVGSDMWSRMTCSSVLVTPEQVVEANAALQDTEYSSGVSLGSSGDVILVYGDEYQDLTSELATLMGRVKDAEHGRTEYN